MNARTWLRAEWDRIAGFGLVLLGAVLLFVGYVGVRETPFTTEALAYIASGGLGGLFCLGIGVGLLLSADLHDEWRKLDRIEAALRGAPLPDPKEILDLTERRAPMVLDGTDPAFPAEKVHQRAPIQHVVSERSGEPLQRTSSGNHSAQMALALEWRHSGFSRAMRLGSVALLFPAGLMVTGWRSAAGTADLDRATDGIGVAILGLSFSLLVVGGSVVWQRQRVARRASALLGGALRLMKPVRGRFSSPDVVATSGSNDAPAGGDTSVLVVRGLHRFHRAGCPTLSGLDCTSVERPAVDPKLQPCGICRAQ